MRHRVPCPSPRPSAADRRPNPPDAVEPDDLLDAIESRFQLLCAGPSPLSVDGRRVGHGLPARRMPLPELAAVLMHPATSYDARDAAWRLVLSRARTGDPAWVVGAVGIAIPGLRSRAHWLRRTTSGDVEATLMEEFILAIRTANLRGPKVLSRLLDTAFGAARAVLRANSPARSGEPGPPPGSTVPPPPFGHPDMVLARAITAGVISTQEAELIGVTRFEDVTVAQYAHAHGESRRSVYHRRRKAEARLVAAIRAGDLTDPITEVVTQATMSTVRDRTLDAYRN
ncbi:MAG TPA: hypothetical protein VNV66_20450 [Pilimelia sp.]|nr:hypothetical protein [Pilimelia sp.]